MRRYIKNYLAFAFILASVVSYGQEYDDLYFTKADRQKEKKQRSERINNYTGDANVTSNYSNDENFEYQEATSFLGKQYLYEPLPETDYENGVSQELIDQYKSNKTQESYTDNQSYNLNQINEVQGQSFSNPNFSNPMDTYQDQNVVVNNYYGNNAGWGNNWNRPRWNVGFGWNNWGGNFWNVSYGWNSFGNPWYDPFWDPRFNGGWGPSWGWNSWGFNGGWNSWGWNRWGWGGYSNLWCSPVWGNGIYGRPVAVYRGENNGRQVVRGARNSRGGAVSSSGRAATVSRNAVAEQRSERRNYNRQQADYLNRSRASRTTSGSLGSNTQSRSSSFIGNTNSSRTSSTYNRGSSTRSRPVYTPPASSRSSSGYNSRSSSSSRSSSGSYRSGSSSSRSSSGRSSSGSSSRSSSSRSSSKRGN